MYKCEAKDTNAKATVGFCSTWKNYCVNLCQNVNLKQSTAIYPRQWEKEVMF